MLNLSSFVTTFCEPEAKDIHDASMFRNFADPDMYPQTKETELKCVQWLHDLWNGPREAEPYGAATIGSSEACMLAGLAHKWNCRQARQKAGKDTSREHYPDYKWDFRLPRVQSINVSGHKCGLIPPGLGWVVFKDRGRSSVTTNSTSQTKCVRVVGSSPPTPCHRTRKRSTASELLFAHI
jgi:glutamate/tyrosine decarboxylase-like PLP-dependent enzyme